MKRFAPKVLSVSSGLKPRSLLRGFSIKLQDRTIIVGVKSPLEKGKANKEVCRKIADYFNVSQAAVRITSGFTSKRKTVEVRGQ